VEKALAKLPKATDLSKERMADAAKQAEEGAAAIGRGEIAARRRPPRGVAISFASWPRR